MSNQTLCQSSLNRTPNTGHGLSCSIPTTTTSHLILSTCCNTTLHNIEPFVATNYSGITPLTSQVFGENPGNCPFDYCYLTRTNLTHNGQGMFIDCVIALFPDVWNRTSCSMVTGSASVTNAMGVSKAGLALLLIGVMALMV